MLYGYLDVTQTLLSSSQWTSETEKNEESVDKRPASGHKDCAMLLDNMSDRETLRGE